MKELAVDIAIVIGPFGKEPAVRVAILRCEILSGLSSFRHLQRLPPHARGIADLDPDRTRTGLVGAIDLLRYDALDPSWHACAKT
jgi:hypothetical protein